MVKNKDACPGVGFVRGNGVIHVTFKMMHS